MDSKKKRIFKKIFTCSFILLLIFSIFNVGRVLAGVDAIRVTDVSIKEKSESAEASIDSFDKDTIVSKVTYHKVNDYVVYKITIKNQDSEDYSIKEIFDDNKDEYLEWEYDKHKNDSLKAGTTKEILLKIIYKKEVTDMSKRVDNNKGKLSFALLDKDGNEVSKDIIINPKTGDNIAIYLVTTIISLIGLVFLLAKKNKKLKKSLLVVLLLMPLMIKALTASFIIEFTSDSKLYDKLLVKVGDEYKTIAYDQKVEKPEDPSKEGYTFEGWYVGDTKYDFDKPVTDDITITPKFKAINYNISYELDGGSATNPSKYTVEDEITLKNPTKSGYSFSGWTGSNGDALQTRVTINKGTTGNKNYVAHFSVNDDTKYKVIHKYKKLTSGTDDEVENLTGTTDTTVRPQTKSKTGFIDPEEQDLLIKGDGTSVLEYVYERETYTFSITDRTYIDSTSTADGTYPYGTSITLKAQNRAGYSFKWSDNDTNLERTVKLTGNLDITPQYTANTDTAYKVIHKKQKLTLDGYDIEETENLSGTTDSSITPAVKSYTGFTAPSTQTTTIAGDGSTVVTYEYNRETYSYSFDNENVTSSKAAGTYPYGTSITVTAKEDETHVFVKWSNDETDNPYTFELTGELNITPLYETTGYKVIFDKNNENATGTMEDETIEEGETKTLTANAYSLTGWLFIGWNTKADGSGDSYLDEEEVTDLTSTESITLYAQWIEAQATFLNGSSFHNKICNLVSNCNNVKSFQRSDTKPSIGNMASNNIISTTESVAPIYAWSDNGNIYYWTEDINPKLNTDSSMMFRYFYYITTIDLSTIDSSNTLFMDQMFSNCNRLTNLDLGDDFDTSNVKSMSYMFNSCSSLTSLDLENKFDTSNVTDMSYMFQSCSSLTSLDLKNRFDTSNVTNMYHMFTGCSDMTNLSLGNSFNTSNVTEMESMFANCGSLSSMNLGDKFDTSKVNYMTSMFSGCSSLTSLDLGEKFDTSNVTRMGSMFSGCSNLTNLNLGDKFDTSNVTDMSDMFLNCNSLTNLDLGDKFDTSRVTKMSRMFKACTNLKTIDVTLFDTRNVEYFGEMFRDCSSLTTIYASRHFVVNEYEGSYNARYMFQNDTKLVGGEGTKYSSSYYEEERAFIDKGSSRPGYFTAGLPTVAITFNPTGGYVNTESKLVDKGLSAMSLPVATKSGYDFVGWYTEIYGGTFIDEDTPINDNVTVYAHWVESNLKVIKDNNNNQTIDTGDEILYGTDEFYVVDNDGSSVLLITKYNLDNNSRQSKKGYEKVAFSDSDYWSGVTYTSSEEYGTEIYSTIEHDFDEDGEYSYYVYETKEGYQTSNYLYQIVDNYRSYLESDKGISGIEDVRLMSRHEYTYRDFINEQDYWLGSARSGNTYYYRDDDVEQNNPIYYDYGEPYIYAVYNGDIDYKGYNDYSLGIRPIVVIDESYLKDNYTVTFDTDGGSEIPDITVQYGDRIDPETPSNGDLKFMGWFKDPEFNNEFNKNEGITRDTTLYAKFVDWCKSFSTDSWSTIASRINEDPTYYGYGCEKTVRLNMDGTNKDYTVRLANTTTTDECNTKEGYSQTACGTVIEFVDVVASKRMNETNTNAGGWKESELVSWLNGEFYNKLPTNLKNIIIPTYPIVSNAGYNQQSLNITGDDNDKNKIYLLSGTDLSSANSYGRQLDYYSEEIFGTKNKKWKTNIAGNKVNWWLRDAYNNSNSYFYYDSNYNYLSSGNSNVALGIAPAFRIGTPSYHVIFDTDGGSKITKQMIKNGGYASRPETAPEKTMLEFDDWYTDDTYTTKFDFENTPITSDITIYAKYKDDGVCKSFLYDSWSDIKTNLASDSNYYAVGCEKSVPMDMDNDSKPEKYTVRLSNTSKPEVCNTEGYSQTACGTVIEFVNIVDMYNMNSTNTNAGGWAGSEMVTYLNSNFYNKLPAELQTEIIPTFPIVSGSGSGGVSPNITDEDTTKNKIYLLSTREVGFDLGYDNKRNVTTDTRTLDYYVGTTSGSDSKRIKKNLSGSVQAWWLRSAYSSHNRYFYYVNNIGNNYDDYASYAYGVAPAFRIQ